MLASDHIYAERVRELLRATRDALPDDAPRPLFGGERLGLELVLIAPAPPPSDATNYLGAIGDMLEAKAHRGDLHHLGELATVELYLNDRQIDEVRYRVERGNEVRYMLRIWTLSS